MGGFATLPVLASRGCARTCSFCSIHTFYRTAPGKVVRVRKPAKVVEEMLHLERYHQVRVFLFQDDDFPRMESSRAALGDRAHGAYTRAGLPIARYGRSAAARSTWKPSCLRCCAKPVFLVDADWGDGGELETQDLSLRMQFGEQFGAGGEAATAAATFSRMLPAIALRIALTSIVRPWIHGEGFLTN